MVAGLTEDQIGMTLLFITYLFIIKYHRANSTMFYNEIPYAWQWSATYPQNPKEDINVKEVNQEDLITTETIVIN